MAGRVVNASSGVKPVAATTGSPNSPSNSPAFQAAAKTVYSDLNSGNYADAWKTALGTSSMFGTGMSAMTTDPLLQALETSQGLKAFDPSKKWDANSLNDYYSAFNATGAYHGNNTGTNGFLGKNPYGNWGDASAITSGKDQAANIAQEGATPDIARFVGARPNQSFLGKYGSTIASVVGDVAGSFVGDPLLGNQLVGAYDAATGNWSGALGNLASSFTPGLSGALSSATGLGAGTSGALVGAGVGAAGAGLSGGNPLLGAISGGVGGALSGAHAASSIGKAVGGGALGTAAGALAVGGIKMGAGLAANSLFGGSPSSGVAPHAATPTSGVGNGMNYIGAGALGAGALAGGAGAGTDTSLASTLTGALPGLLQGAAGVYGSQNAAEKQTQADQNAINTQQSALGNINNIWATQQGLGQGADKALGTALGTNGQPADYSGFENMPGYKFAISQGTQAIQRQAASLGNAYTPNTAAAVGQYVTGTAMSDYNTYISQLMSAAGLGTSANTGLQTGNQSTANNISQLQQNIGHAQASGVSGASTAVGGAFSPNGVGTSLIGAAGKYLFGGTGGGNIYAGQDPNMFGGGTDPNVSLNSNYVGSNGVGYSDPSQMTGDIGWGQMPTTSNTDFGGGLDYGTSSNDIYNGGTNFLGAF